jgi:hypothetical protein
MAIPDSAAPAPPQVTPDQRRLLSLLYALGAHQEPIATAEIDTALDESTLLTTRMLVTLSSRRLTIACSDSRWRLSDEGALWVEFNVIASVADREPAA